MRNFIRRASIAIVENLESEANDERTERPFDLQSCGVPLRRASITAKSIVYDVCKELQDGTKELPLDLRSYTKPLRRASGAFISIANDVCEVLGINKNSKEAEEFNKQVFNEITSNEAKFEALKINLRSKGLFTNAAIQQYLLKYDKSSNTFKFKRQCKKCDSYRFSTSKISHDYQPSDVIKKEKIGYKWQVPSESTFGRYQNIRACFLDPEY